MAKIAKKKPAKTKPCDCVNAVDEKLRDFNTRIVQQICLDFASGSASTSPTIATVKLDPKKRGQKKVVLPSYCPFCGVKI